jgi:hypothetical protein
VTPSQAEPPRAQNDPRLLLPEWLRDPGEPPKAESPSNGSIRSSRAPIQEPENEGEHIAATSWQQPPELHEGVFDPTTLIAFDDLPAWMQRLHEQFARMPTTETQYLPEAESMAGADAIPDIQPAPRVALPLPMENPADDMNDRVSDLSLSGFAWIAGTAIVLIIAAIAVLFG